MNERSELDEDNDHNEENEASSFSTRNRSGTLGRSILGNSKLLRTEIVDVTPKSLAHLGDAVFHLFEREREIAHFSSAKQMHNRARVNASVQANLLESITPHLTEQELEIVRRARNLKATGSRKAEQATYRLATAFEALLGFLYLTDADRLRAVLRLTLADGIEREPGSARGEDLINQSGATSSPVEPPSAAE